MDEQGKRKRKRRIVKVQGLPDDALLRLDQVLIFVPVSKSTWWNGVKKGIYPPGFKLSERVHVWRLGEILAIGRDGR